MRYSLAEINLANYQNPYDAYTEGSVYTDNPLNLVAALYERAIDATQQAVRAIESRDIPSRTKAINKAYEILTELLVSLNHEKGGEVSQNLQRLYGYMQRQLIHGHAKQLAEPIAEVSSLLTTLLEGWRGAARSVTAQSSSSNATDSMKQPTQPAGATSTSVDSGYGGGYMSGYLDDPTARSDRAYSF